MVRRRRLRRRKNQRKRNAETQRTQRNLDGEEKAPGLKPGRYKNLLQNLKAPASEGGRYKVRERRAQFGCEVGLGERFVVA